MIKFIIILFLAVINISAVTLEENLDNYILSINKVSISPDKSKLLVTDTKQGKLFLFDRKNGKFLYSFKPDIFYNDTIVKINKQKNLLHNNYCTLYELFKIKGGKYDPEKIKKWYNNSVKSASFDRNGNIIALCKINVSRVIKKTDKHKKNLWVMGQTNVLVRIDQENKKSKVFLFDNQVVNDSIRTIQNHYLKVHDSTKIIAISNLQLLNGYNPNSLNKNNSDKIEYVDKNTDLLSIYNYKTGDYLDSKFKTPEVFSKADLGTNIIKLNIHSVNIFDKYYHVFPYDPYLYTCNEKIKLKKLPIKNLKYDHSHFINFYKYDKIQNFKIENIFKLDDNTILIHIYTINPETRKITNSHFCEYETNGNLIKKHNHKRKINGIYIYYTHYSQKLDQFIYFVKDNQGWTVKYENYN